MSKRTVIFLLVIALAVALRVWGLGFGLPDILHADEPIVVNKAMSFGTGDFNPHWFLIPPLTSYMLFILYGIFFLAGHISGFFHSTEDFISLYLSDPTYFYLIGRFFLGVVPSIISVLMVRKIAKEVSGNEDISIAAAFFLSVTFLFVRDAHYIYADMPRIASMLCAIFYYVKISKGNKTADYVSASFFTGLAVAFKYNSALLVFPFFAAFFMGRNAEQTHSRKIKKLFLSVFIMFAVYILLNPFSLLDFKTFINDFKNQSSQMSAAGICHHVSYSLLHGMSLSLLACSALGIARELYMKNKTALILIIFIAAEYAALVFFSQPHARYVLPLIPVLCYFAASFIYNLSRILSGDSRRTVWFVVICLVMSAPTFIKTCYSDYLFSAGDTRKEAKRWIEENIRKGEKIALDHTFFGPALLPDKSQIQHKITLAGRKKISGAKTLKLKKMLEMADKNEGYKLYYLKDEPSDDETFLFSMPQIPFSYDYLIDNNIRFVVITSVNPDCGHPDFIKKIYESADLAAEFSPYRDAGRKYSSNRYVLTGGPFLDNEVYLRNKTGYTIRIYEIGSDGKSGNILRRIKRKNIKRWE
ncbi:MAG: glycosyltransferase family 39 protein [bacterium]|nr:glycosyltransferase family 39 protein [bacterium]